LITKEGTGTTRPLIGAGENVEGGERPLLEQERPEATGVAPVVNISTLALRGSAFLLGVCNRLISQQNQMVRALNVLFLEIIFI
jgi:hypothetical protein